MNIMIEKMNTYELVLNLLAMLCVIAVFVAIITDFIFYDKREDTKTERKSLVTTGTMTIFFVLYYLVLRSPWGSITVPNSLIYRLLPAIGAALILIGAITNIWGRIQLKSNWANQIKIYNDQSLVTTGVYALVRHPLYSSIMLMFIGGSIMFMNYLSLILTAIIFIPFMYYRARQEEVILAKQFREYTDYKKHTGMFFPKIIKGVR